MLVAIVALPGCQIGVRVGVDAHADGGGVVRAVVTLDRDAASKVPDLASELKVDDLTKAGWHVVGPRTGAGGAVTVEADHTFRAPADAGPLVAQLSGPQGLFRDFIVTRSRGVFRTRTAFRGTVDLSSGPAGFSDPQLQQRLGGSPFGVDEAALEKQLGTTLARIFRVEVVARLPGSTTSNAPGQATNGAVWRPQLGERVVLRASASQLRTGNVVLAVLAFVFGLGSIGLVAARVVHRRS